MGMFWNDVTSIEPLRQHRWILSNGAGVWVWAKSVKLPQFAVETQKYQIGNHKLNYPGLLEWQDVTVTIVDITSQSDDKKHPRSMHLFKRLSISGYDIKNDRGMDGMNKKSMVGNVKSIFGKDDGDFKITQINAKGEKIQEWTLYNPLIKDVSFGQLDYSNDELITLDLTIAYDHAELTS